MVNSPAETACCPSGTSFGAHTHSRSVQGRRLVARRHASEGCRNVARLDRDPCRRRDAERPAGRICATGCSTLTNGTGRTPGQRPGPWSSISIATQFVMSDSGLGRAISSPGWCIQRPRRGLSASIFCSRNRIGLRAAITKPMQSLPRACVRCLSSSLQPPTPLRAFASHPIPDATPVFEAGKDPRAALPHFRSVAWPLAASRKRRQRHRFRNSAT